MPRSEQHDRLPAWQRLREEDEGRAVGFACIQIVGDEVMTSCAIVGDGVGQELGFTLGTADGFTLGDEVGATVGLEVMTSC